jgi:hypothetical protein
LRCPPPPVSRITGSVLRSESTQMNGAKFQLEQDIVNRFVRLLGYTQFSLSDPNAGQKADTGQTSCCW